MIKILIADDHTIVRDGLKQLFALYDDIDVMDEAADGGEVLNLLRDRTYDLLLLDMSMRGISGLDLIGRIHIRYPAQRMLILSMHAEPNVATRALKAGAHGYLTKDADSGTLLTAIRKVSGGARFMDPSIGVRLAFDMDETVEMPPEASLSNREFTVMQHLLRGMGVNDIAKELKISNKTVSTHKVRLMKKLGVKSTAELFRYAIQKGIE